MQRSNSFRPKFSWLQGIYSGQTLRAFFVSHDEGMNMARFKEFKTIMALAAMLFLSGCHLAAIGGASGALIGGAVADKRGAMIGGGAGLLAGAAAEALFHTEHPQASYSACDSFSTLEERLSCQRGRAQAEEQNWRDRVYRAERYGYDLQRNRYRY